MEINDAKSDVLQITTGVPQGSILGPVLFIIYINDFSQASQVFNFISYADDTVLFSTLSNLTNPQNTDPDFLTNAELFKINEWLEINKLSLNTANTKYMLFHTHQKRVKSIVPKINNTNIEKVEEFKFLGLTLDTHLNWKIHSENISNKCSRISAIYIYNSILIWELPILKRGARTPRTVTKFAVKTAIDLTQTI